MTYKRFLLMINKIASSWNRFVKSVKSWDAVLLNFLNKLLLICQPDFKKLKTVKAEFDQQYIH